MDEPINPFSQLPALLKKVLEHEENIDINIDICRSMQLNDDQSTALMGVIRKVIFKTIRPEEVVAALKKDLELGEQQAKKLALDLLGRRFLVMQWYIGNVEAEIAKLGGDVVKYDAEARKLYPEVYEPHAQDQEHVQEVEQHEETPAIETPSTSETGEQEPTILRAIDDRLTTNKGRAEILLRMTALSQQIETAGKSGALNETQTGELLHGLDALSYAVNTQDLNPLEIAAIKRRLKSILSKVPKT